MQLNGLFGIIQKVARCIQKFCLVKDLYHEISLRLLLVAINIFVLIVMWTIGDIIVVVKYSKITRFHLTPRSKLINEDLKRILFFD
ncbi:hypothetical protein MHTCC0001_10760 [Flavobacteriaceae bacterium MHTCC 0001]